MLVPFLQVVLSEEMQNTVGVVFQVAEVLTDTMNKILPAVSQLQSYLLSIKDLNLVANNDFNQVRPLYSYNKQFFSQCTSICL